MRRATFAPAGLRRPRPPQVRQLRGYGAQSHHNVAPAALRWERPLSLNHLNPRAMARRLGECLVAGHHRRIEGLGQSYVHRVVRGDVLTQFPRAGEEIEMG